MLIAVRDQVLALIFISISAEDTIQANMIFEILNAKGKQLTPIDLIKNKIFEIFDTPDLSERANEYWEAIKKALCKREDRINISMFYGHFWASKYKKSQTNNMYKDFCIEIQQTESCYNNFLLEMQENAEMYMKIVNPERRDYKNKQAFFPLVQSLKTLNKDFFIIQVRIPLLALFHTYNEKHIDSCELIKTVQYLEEFHFAYNKITRGSPNRIEKNYSDFAIKLRKCEDKDTARETIKNQLFKKLDDIFPDFNVFCSRFVELTYSGENNTDNLKTKYIIKKLYCYYQNKKFFPDDGTIEHIIPESTGGNSTNIGNLILLEGDLNGEVDRMDYEEKIEIYKKSDYKCVHTFVAEHPTWTNEMIAPRAQELAEIYYTKILRWSSMIKLYLQKDKNAKIT